MKQTWWNVTDQVAYWGPSVYSIMIDQRIAEELLGYRKPKLIKSILGKAKTQRKTKKVRQKGRG